MKERGLQWNKKVPVKEEGLQYKIMSPMNSTERRRSPMKLSQINSENVKKNISSIKVTWHLSCFLLVIVFKPIFEKQSENDLFG